MHVRCMTCRHDFGQMPELPPYCLDCGGTSLLILVDGDEPIYPYELSKNDKQMLRDRGIVATEEN